MKRLTKSEEQIMQLFWDNGPSLVSALISMMDDPKPPHSTVSSVVRILERKGFLEHKAYGRTFEYHPIITKDEYSKRTIKEVISNYFNDSPKALVSFLIKNEQVDIDELTELVKTLEKK